jgi:hypothetical protein
MTMSLPGQSPQRQRTARIAGVWFVITFVASMQLGALLEIVTAIAGIAVAVVLFGIVKWRSEAAGLLKDIVLVGTVLIGAGWRLLDGLRTQTELTLIEAEAHLSTSVGANG